MNLLPIGSIVYLKEGTKKLMILNRLPITKQEDQQLYFDYSGCIYPQGVVPEEVFYFNQENIDKVVFTGYIDEAEERFLSLVNEWVKDIPATIKKGTVTKR